MKLIFVSNYFNHHQLPFCDALYELLEGDFCFLQTQPMEEERVKMGWQAEERPYVRYAAKNSCAYKSGGEKTPGSESNSNAVTDAEDFEKLLFTADVVIFGGCDDESYIQERLTAGNRSSVIMNAYIRKGNGRLFLREACCKNTRITPDTVRHRCISCAQELMCLAIIT